MKSRSGRRLVFGPHADPAENGPKLQTRPPGTEADAPLKLVKNPDMTWHDHLVMLLHIAAEIEHGLMVQYLYAAYSIGGEQIPERHREMVDRWRTSILAVAKEEMGHLLTVQNVLMLLGAPINLDRQDFPWDTQYYPFPFKLEPFTLDSLSAYVFAEMPRGGEVDIPKKAPVPPRFRNLARDIPLIVESVKQRVRGGTAHAVGTIYEEVIELIGDERRIPDAAFEDASYAAQGSWDDWGRGYKPDPRLLDAEGNPIDGSAKPAASERDPYVLIDRVATRTEAIAALRALSAQGEAPHLSSAYTGEPSHFERFLEIYDEFTEVAGEGWSPSRPVPANPSTLNSGSDYTFIDDESSRAWANLFNVRYRMLLTYLSHTFRLARVTRNDVPSVRGVMMHRVFGEMYNLKTIAEILVGLPLHASAAATIPAERAGPPFEMPYTLSLPPAELDAWRLHRDLLGSADHRAYAILSHPGDTGREYLKAMIDIDAQTRAWLDSIIGGLDPADARRAKQRTARTTTAAHADAAAGKDSERKPA